MTPGRDRGPDPGPDPGPDSGGHPGRDRGRDPEGRALRRYRVLLSLFPRAFREERGAELERLFLDMWTSRRRRGRGTGPAFWIPLVWDAASHALRERLFRRRRSSHPEFEHREPLVTALWTDLGKAARSMLRQPVYAGMIVLMMTLAIAGNSAVFRIHNGLFLKPLPFPDPGRLVDLDTRAPSWDLDYTGVAYADFHAWREQNRTFQGMGVFDVEGANFAGEDDAVFIEIVQASHDLAATLGLEPVVGRLFTAEEDVPDGPAVAVLTHGFWQRRYGADPEVVGRSALLDGEAWEIVGVLPPEADFVAEAGLWVPLQEDPDAHSSFFLQGVGRLLPEVAPETAAEDLTAVHKRLVERWRMNEITFPVVTSLRDRYLGELRVGSSALLAAVAMVLLIACANIAGLMLARSLARRREVGIRLAMGAGRGRIVRQLLTESVVLAALGAAVGSAVGVWASGLVVEGLREQFPSWVTFPLDARLVLFTVAVTGGAAVLFGLVPSLQAAGTEIGDALQGPSGRMTASRGRRRSMGVLVGVEVALAFLLLVFAGFGLRDLRALLSVDPGFRTENVLTYVVQLPEGRYQSAEARLAFWSAHLERIRGLSGVLGAGATSIPPLGGHTGYFFQVEGAERGEDEPNPVVLVRAVTPGYLEAMGVEVLTGRPFAEHDGRDEGAGVVAVNETFVRQFLGHLDDPLSGRVRAGRDDDDPWWSVVAVTRDTRHYGLAEEMRPGVFLPLPQMSLASLTVAIRTGGEPGAFVEAARAVLREQDPQLAMFRVTTMEARFDESLWTRRAASWLIAAFAGVALLLAVAGIYGVISYGVKQRLQEIGIRMALGARRGQIAGQVLLQGMLIVAGGTMVGLGAALLAVPLVSGSLFIANTAGPSVYVGAVAVLVLVAGLANLLPALRAVRLEPRGVLTVE